MTEKATRRETAQRVFGVLDRSGRHPRPIATGIEPAATFWRAQDDHQQYLALRGGTFWL